ncbi:YdiU family protein [Rhodoferax sp. PAMC 29310]|uniref:protein adenylyltransferase SelO n=1 Tax=Rhodoferax sp. PAMC 29310 TaxID=2822760 RepID=UPI001B323B0D|nr:YdiU family protein [Rhodoferax sp. PAMC 29310]
MTTASSRAGAGFIFDNSYARDLEGGYAPWQAAQVPTPVLVKLNRELATELGLDADALDGDLGAAIFSGNQAPEGAKPLAQAYAGHQFGGFSPQLGDGRALLLGEVLDRQGRRRDIAFKGSGRTPFSRSGDGKAALGPVLREYLIGEAMYALGIPTTRALAVATTGESVRRDTGALPGAVLTRVAASHIRVGTFQFFASRQEEALLRRLADHVIERHDPALKGQPNPYLGLLQAVSERQAALIARWMGVGFIHGVMNTDNMTVSGETIDYGPCAFMDHYDPSTVFSSIDTGGRYAYSQQPLIARWNLARLAETLLPLLHDDPQSAVDLVMPIIDGFPARYEHFWLAEMRAKLGLEGEEAGDLALAQDFLGSMQGQGVDFTQAFRALASAAKGQPESLRALYLDAQALDAWLPRWQERAVTSNRTLAARAQAMNAVNPAYIPRNHRVEEALDAAVKRGDFTPFERLLAVLQHPFDERPEFSDYAQSAPAEVAVGYRTFCGT